ncbi:hypothetical protein [Tumebacillus flagellatus]|uniref:Uncharacterized protein n=1 Tax=Tumebacillus flagellatus TaxID=1157490 RepID=A0A074LNV0_9BACL|nr:hypothetical protein [Tumebacillus flagellatus]KEO82779.1 hypothetical protein EL26_13600 [Tumebacillus flagellatus]
MGSTTIKMLYLSVAMILFLSALSVGYYLFTSTSKALDQTYVTTQNMDRTQTTTLKETSQSDPVLGSVVVQTIYQYEDSGIHIYVDGVDRSDPTGVGVINLKAKFNVNLVRDTQGTLTSIRYTTTS